MAPESELKFSCYLKGSQEALGKQRVCEYGIECLWYHAVEEEEDEATQAQASKAAIEVGVERERERLSNGASDGE